MIINSQTRIATLLKQDTRALDAIISISPVFEKLRNPLLRKLMAGRTTIAMACKVAGCSVENFLDALQPLGFRKGEEEKIPERSADSRPSILLQCDKNKISMLDVRPILEGGKDPLDQIMRTIHSLKEDDVLCIINSFEPTPLIALLGTKGYLSFTEKGPADSIYTWFYRENGNSNPVPKATAGNLAAGHPAKGDQAAGQLTESLVSPHEADDWQILIDHFRDRTRTIDVRELEMPGPMHAILEELESIPRDHALFVHHKRIPVFLLPELKQSGFDFRAKTLGEQEVDLLIFKEDQ